MKPVNLTLLQGSLLGLPLDLIENNTSMQQFAAITDEQGVLVAPSTPEGRRLSIMPLDMQQMIINFTNQNQQNQNQQSQTPPFMPTPFTATFPTGISKICTWITCMYP